MNLDENELLSVKQEKKIGIIECHPILEDIGNTTLKNSENIQSTSGEYKKEEGKLVTVGYLKNVNDFSVQALESIKSIRNYINTTVHNTNNSVTKTAQSLRSMIAKNNFLNNLINSKKNINTVNLEEEVTAPWVGTTNEEEAKKLILFLSENRKLFLRKPPEGVFEFSLDESLPIAKMLLKEDIRLRKLRFELVPKCIKEDEFWRNYFYRIDLIKKSFSISLSKLKSESPNSEACLAQENPSNLIKNANGEIHDCSNDDNTEQTSMKIENSLGGNEENPQNDNSFETMLETEIQEFNSFCLDDTGEKIENDEWEKELEKILGESLEND